MADYARMVQRRIRRTGDAQSYTLRRPHAVYTDTGDAIVLELVNPANPGDTTVQVTGQGIRGKVPADLGVTIGGESVMVTAAAEVDQEVFQIDFLPALVGGHSAGATVTLDDYLELTYTRFTPKSSSSRNRFGAVGTERTAWVYGDEAPQVGDILIETGERVQRVHPMQPGAMVAAWALLLGEVA